MTIPKPRDYDVISDSDDNSTNDDIALIPSPTFLDRIIENPIKRIRDKL